MPNTSINTLFQFNIEKSNSNMGNIFGDIPTDDRAKQTNIFGTTSIESAKIFSQNNYKDSFKNNKEFQLLQDNKSFSNIPPLQTKIERNNSVNYEMNKEKSIPEDQVNRQFEQTQYENTKLTDFILPSLEEEKKKNDEAKLREKQMLEKLNYTLQEKAKLESEKIILELVEEEVLEIAQSEVDNLQIIVQASDMQCQLLISEVVNICVKDIVKEEYARMCYNKLLLNRYFSRWISHLRRKKDQMKLIENIPMWTTTTTRAEYALVLKHPCQIKNLEMIKRYRFGQSCDFNSILKFERDVCEDDINPLNLFALVDHHLLPKQNLTSIGLLQQRKYFKFLITLPNDKEELTGFESYSNKLLTKFIQNARLDSGPFVHGIEHNVALCVRKFNGIISKNEQGDEVTTEGDHNDGIICFITGVDIDKHSRKRLHNLLKLTKNFKRVPLAIIAYNCSFNNEELATILDLDTLQKDGLIFSYKILGCQVNKKDFRFRKIFIKAVSFITKESYLLNSNEIQAMEMQKASIFLETSLGEEIWQRWRDSANINPIFNKICSLPNHVIGIFNQALDHLLQITQEDLQEMPEFPEEFKDFIPESSGSNIPLTLEYFPAKWKNNIKKSFIKTFLKSLYLPNVDEKVPNNIEDLKQWLFNYSSICLGDDDLATAKSSFEAISNLVNQANKELTSSISMINYLTIIKPVIYARINNMLKKDYAEFNNLYIIYLKDEFKNYQSQPWWLNYKPLNLVSIDYNSIPLNLDETPLQTNKENCFPVDDIDKIVSKAEVTSRKAECMISDYKRRKLDKGKICSAELSTTKKLKRTLDDSLYQFELSKKVGEYNTSFVTDLTQGIDESINEMLGQPLPKTQKRTKSSLTPSDQCSEINQVIAKAMNLINEIESVEDKKLKIKRFNIN